MEGDEAEGGGSKRGENEREGKQAEGGGGGGKPSTVDLGDYSVFCPPMTREMIQEIIAIIEGNEDTAPTPEPPVFVLNCPTEFHAILSSNGAKERLKKILRRLLLLDKNSEITLYVDEES